MHHRDLARGRARHDARHCENVGARTALDKNAPVIVLDRFAAKDSGADDRTDASGTVFVDADACLPDGLLCRDHCQQAEAIHGDKAPSLDTMIRQLLDLGADPHLQLVQRRGGYFPDARPALPHRAPNRGDIGAE